MTAELADCYRTKRDGVDAILSSVELAAGGTRVQVWQTTGHFVTPSEARVEPLLTAAANWHALATFLGPLAPAGGALLIDIGTTTCDIVPLVDGQPVPAGRTDRERLQAGELVYTGVRRTPVCAVAGSVPFRGGWCPVMAELFATTLDVYLTTGDLLEDSDRLRHLRRPTGHGLMRTRSAGPLHRLRQRRILARRRGDSRPRPRRGTATAYRAGALEAVLRGQPLVPNRLFLSGVGSFLGRRVLASCPQLADVATVSLLEIFGPAVAEAACAFAVARLAAQANAPASG